MFNGLNTTDIFVHSFENANPVDGASIEIIFKTIDSSSRAYPQMVAE